MTELAKLQPFVAWLDRIAGVHRISDAWEDEARTLTPHLDGYERALGWQVLALVGSYARNEAAMAARRREGGIASGAV